MYTVIVSPFCMFIQRANWCTQISNSIVCSAVGIAETNLYKTTLSISLKCFQTINPIPVLWSRFILTRLRMPAPALASSVVHNIIFSCNKSCEQFYFLLFWDLFIHRKVRVLYCALPELHLKGHINVLHDSQMFKIIFYLNKYLSTI